MPVSLAENPLSFRTLYESPLVGVLDYTCSACRGGPSGDENPAGDQVVLMRHGAFSKHFGRRSVTADVNQAVFFSKESSYRVSHPGDRGDRGTIFIVSPRVLNEIVRELDPSDERWQKPFPFVTGPCEPGVFLRHRELVQRLDAIDSVPLEPMWADVTALQLVADVLEAAFERHASRARGEAGKRLRKCTDDIHRDRVEAAKTYLAARLGERVTLDDVSRAVYVSPFHLSRVFHESTGVPIHRYLTQLRLRSSLERLADGADDLTALALDLGFSSHSHFTDAFRREFGHAPSEMRRSR